MLNVKQAAQHAGVSKSYLDKHRVYGGGPIFIKIGGPVVNDQINLVSWLTGKKVANTSQAMAVAS